MFLSRRSLLRPGVLAGLGALILFTTRPAAAQYAHLTLHSQPGEFIGQGKDYDVIYTPSYSGIFRADLERAVGGGLPQQVAFAFAKPSPSDGGSILDFGTNQLGLPLQPGTYTDAQSYFLAAPDHAGLYVAYGGNSPGDKVTGSFTITNLSLSPDAGASSGYRVEAFDAKFEQYFTGRDPGLFGTLSYRASGPAPAVPEASGTASLGLLLALGMGGLLMNRRKQVRRS